MHDKGYDHPLHTLDLVPLAQAGEDAPRYAIFTPQGRLVVRPGLRRRGADVSTAHCDEAVAIGLLRHRVAEPAFARCGLDAQWADNMLYWRQRMVDQEVMRAALQAELDDAQKLQQALLLRGQEIWTRLGLVSRLAGLGGLVVRGRAPKAGLLLGDALREAADRARQPAFAAALSAHGLSAAELREIDGLLRDLSAARQSAEEQARSYQQASDALTVMRGALIGDLSRLCRAAPYVVPGPHARVLRLGHLLGRQRPHVVHLG